MIDFEVVVVIPATKWRIVQIVRKACLKLRMICGLKI